MVYSEDIDPRVQIQEVIRISTNLMAILNMLIQQANVSQDKDWNRILVSLIELQEVLYDEQVGNV